MQDISRKLLFGVAIVANHESFFTVILAYVGGMHELSYITSYACTPVAARQGQHAIKRSASNVYFFFQVLVFCVRGGPPAVHAPYDAGVSLMSTAVFLARKASKSELGC
jgi:hypothetical protein